PVHPPAIVRLHDLAVLVEVRDVAERLVAEAVLLKRADAELGVEHAVQALGEVEVLGVGPDLIAEHQHRELVHAAPDAGQGVGVADGLEVDRARLGDEARVELAECQRHRGASRSESRLLGAGESSRRSAACAKMPPGGDLAMNVGFIGLGIMGAGMASNLQAAGHALVVHDVRRAAAAPHLAAGATWKDTPKAVAEAVDVVCTSLPGPAEVEQVALGPDGLIHGMRAGSVLVDLTTNAPGLVRRLHGLFGARGVAVLDAPVSGGPAGARSRRLAIW